MAVTWQSAHTGLRRRAFLQNKPAPRASARIVVGERRKAIPAAWLAEKKVGTLVAGEFGAKLAQALKDRKIGAVTANGPAAQAAKKARP